jgi:hypothetical protein
LGVAQRRPLTVILPAILLLAVGLALGILKKPTFTATDRAGLQINSSQPTALGGITEATVAEAATFSRAATSNAVVDAAAQAVGLNPVVVANSVSAAPVPQSGDIDIVASAKSSGLAMRLVNAVSNSMSEYIAVQTSASSDSGLLLRQYEAASTSLHSLQRPGAATRFGTLQAVRLKVETLKLEYQNGLLAPVTKLIVFSRATTASSDRVSKALLLGLIGVVAGAVIGFALCALRARRLHRPIRAA